VEKEEKENKGFPFHLHRYCNSNQYLVFQHILECFFSWPDGTTIDLDTFDDWLLAKLFLILLFHLNI